MSYGLPWPETVETMERMENVIGIANWGKDAPLDDSWQIGDFNGDGKIDLVDFRTDARFWISLSNGVAKSFSGQRVDPIGSG